MKLTPKQIHMKWLEKHGCSRATIKVKKTALGNPNSIPNYKTDNPLALSNNIPANVTISPESWKANFCNSNYTIMPAYNKGNYSVISKSDIVHAGKK